MSSANRVWPVTFARASTLRRGTPITRSLSLLDFGASAGVVRESFSSGMRPPWLPVRALAAQFTLPHFTFLVCDLEHGGFHGFENLQVAGAPAQVSGNRCANLIACGVRVLIQQSLGRDQDCRRAIAALRRSEIGKSILQGMQVSIFSKAFDGEYLPSATFEGQHQAGKHWLAVEKNGASAALSQFTAVFRAGMKEILAQYFQQSLIGREGDIGFFAIQRESYLRRFLRFDRQCAHVQAPRRQLSG